MSEISTEKILDGITLALRSAYPDSHIESDTVEQGLHPPAFLVHLVSAGQKVRVGKRWQRTPGFDVIYFPKAGREECYAIADDLCRLLEVIALPTGDLLRGTGMNFEVVDGVLHFLVSYHHFVFQKTREETMENLEIKQGKVC